MVTEFNLIGRKLTVINLPVHLKGKHIIFHPGNKQEACEKSMFLLILYFGRPDTLEMNELTYFFMIFMSSPESTRVVQNPALMRFSIWMGNTSLRKDRWVIVLRASFGSLQLEASSMIWECCLSRNPWGGYEDLYALWGPDWKMFQQAARELELVDDKKEFFDALEEAACFMKADSWGNSCYATDDRISGAENVREI